MTDEEIMQERRNEALRTILRVGEMPLCPEIPKRVVDPFTAAVNGAVAQALRRLEDDE